MSLILHEWLDLDNTSIIFNTRGLQCLTALEQKLKFSFGGSDLKFLHVIESCFSYSTAHWVKLNEQDIHRVQNYI